MNTSRLLLLFLLPFLSSSCTRLLHHKPNSHISVMGIVYCDACSNNNFSRHSYFLPGAEVSINCRFNVMSAKTAEQISFTVRRSTNRYGVYKLEIPAVDGIRCAEEGGIASACQATLMRSSTASCNIPGYRTTADEITVKSRQANLCIYSLNALNFRPSKRDNVLCGKH